VTVQAGEHELVVGDLYVGELAVLEPVEEEHKLSFWDALIVQAAIQADAERPVSEDLQNGRSFGVLTREGPFRRT
jgi:predicted nucleic acid-binding protein